MMKIAKIPLEPNSRFHFGEFNIDVNIALSSTSNFAHSDTLFSALINSYNLVGDANSFVKQFINSQINISSLFYYIKRGNKQILFLPKPVFLEIDAPNDGHHKFRNKIGFISLSIWNQGFNQNEWTTDKYRVINNKFLLLASEYDTLIKNLNITNLDIFSVVQTPKSPIRNSEDSIFYQTDIEIANNESEEIKIGFYFYYNAEEDAEIMLMDATNLLSKWGIGGEKNNMGRVLGDPIFENFVFDKPSEKYTNISLVSPKNLDDFNKIKYYKTIIRGGRKLRSGKQYKTVRLIKEGAQVLRDLEGQYIKIGTDSNNNPALRNGKAFLIPVYE